MLRDLFTCLSYLLDILKDFHSGEAVKDSCCSADHNQHSAAFEIQKEKIEPRQPNTFTTPSITVEVFFNILVIFRNSLLVLHLDFDRGEKWLHCLTPKRNSGKEPRNADFQTMR